MDASVPSTPRLNSILTVPRTIFVSFDNGGESALGFLKARFDDALERTFST